MQMPASPVALAVGFHAAFNILAGLCLLPFTPYADRLMRRLVPDDKQDEDTLAAPRYLDPRALATPSVALSNAMVETVRMSEVLDRMFATAQAALQSGSLETLKLLRGIDERLNAFQTAVREYLADLSQASLSEQESRRALEIVLYVSNLEHAGDVIHLNLSDRIKTKAKESIAFTAEEQASLNDLCLIIHDNIRLATGVLTSGDVEGASRLIAQKDAFRVLENKVLDEHFKGKTRGRGTLRRGALFVDMIRDLHRINSHVAAAGYPIVDAAGLLRGSRLKGPNRKKRK
jgi:phosphate:Na+ symporter